MTSFDVSAHTRFAGDPAMVNCTGPILFDESLQQENLVQYVPMSASQQNGGMGPNCYNGITDIRFAVNGDLSSRIRYDKSYLRVDYVAYDMTTPATPKAIDPDTCSIPWNPVAALITSTYYQLNGTNQTVEKLDGNFQHGNMIKALTTYTREALEAASDRFFTPCMEDTRDLKSTLSTTSKARAAQNLVDAEDLPVSGSKIIMLSDIFDSFKPPYACFSQLLYFMITFKSTENILFQTSANTGVNRFYITNLRLFVVQDKLSDPQLTIETARIDSQDTLLRVGYNRYDVQVDTHTSAKTYIMTGIKNMQAAILMFSSTQCGDNIGVNPYQYCYASGSGGTTGLTFYRHRYGTTMYPMSGQVVETTNKMRNTEPYTIWRTLTRMISQNSRFFASPIDFYDHIGKTDSTKDISSYVFFGAVFSNPETAPMRVASGYDHEIVTSGGTATNGIIVRIRVNAYSIGHDTMVTVMD
jgi:hypothetical protein